MDKLDKSEQKCESKEASTTHRPSPSDFDVYLPWACNQLQVEVNVVMFRVQQSKLFISYDYSFYQVKFPE